MRPATPRHPAHDSGCPFCGEPFKAARIFGRRSGLYDCGRCKQPFVLWIDQYATVDGQRLPTWEGEPL